MSEEKNSNNNEEIQVENTSVDSTNNEETKDKTEKKIKNKKTRATLVAVLVGVLCLGIGFVAGKETGRKLPATSKSYGSSKVIATVGDEKITEKDLKYRMEPLFYINAKEKLTEEEIEAYEASFIDYMTTVQVLYLEGKEQEITATEAEITTEYESLLSSLSTSFGITEEMLLNKFKIPKDYIEKDLEKELIGTKYLGEATDVSDKEAQNYYDKNKDEFLSIKASHILIQTRDDEGNTLSAEEKKEKKAEAEKILKQIKEGSDFTTLAKEYSEDTSADSGGDLGYFGKGQMVEEFEDAAFALKVGSVTDKLVETDYGYHIIMKTDEKYEEYDDVKEDIKYNLSYEKQTNTLDNLIEKYNVTVK